jgi:outer membrane lipoprotein-sorting protein
MSFTGSSATLKLLAVLVLASVVMAPPIYADDWPGIYEKTKAKYAKFQDDIKDMTIQQEIAVITPNREMVAESKMMKKGGKFRMENTIDLPEMPKEMGPMTTIIIHDGIDAWMISSMMGTHKLVGNEKKQYEMAGDWWAFLPPEAISVGSEKIGSHECHVVEFEEGGAGPYTKVWIDKKKLLLIQAESTLPDGKTAVMSNSDFRKVAKKWELPYKTELTMDGELLSTVVVTSIEINKNLSDELFDHEKAEVKGPNMEEMMKMMQEKGE